MSEIAHVNALESAIVLSDARVIFTDGTASQNDEASTIQLKLLPLVHITCGIVSRNSPRNVFTTIYFLADKVSRAFYLR